MGQCASTIRLCSSTIEKDEEWNNLVGGGGEGAKRINNQSLTARWRTRVSLHCIGEPDQIFRFCFVLVKNYYGDWVKGGRCRICEMFLL